MAKVGEFLLPEAQAAQARWSDITGLDESSSDWGEVWRVLFDSRLLDADRMAEQELDLFDLPSSGSQHPSQKMRRLRVAVIAGAEYWASQKRYDVATATAIVVAVMNRVHPGVISDEERTVRELVRELPDRVVEVFATRSDALRWRIDKVLASWKPEDRARVQDSELHTILTVASAYEMVAEEVFMRLSAARFVRIALLPLCYGGWLALHLN
jgi:hypothetical protein